MPNITTIFSKEHSRIRIEQRLYVSDIDGSFTLMTHVIELVEQWTCAEVNSF